jgi:hypothetical protein
MQMTPTLPSLTEALRLLDATTFPEHPVQSGPLSRMEQEMAYRFQTLYRDAHGTPLPLARAERAVYHLRATAAPAPEGGNAFVPYRVPETLTWRGLWQRHRRQALGVMGSGASIGLMGGPSTMLAALVAGGLILGTVALWRSLAIQTDWQRYHLDDSPLAPEALC